MQELAWCAVSLAMATSPFKWTTLHSFASTVTAKPNPSTFFLFNLYQHAHESETRRGLIYGIPHGVQTELATFVSDSLGFSRLWNEVLDSMDQGFWEEKEAKVRI
jgi:hypothetical protein